MNSNYEIVRELIEYNCGGVDKYIHNNSTWLIFTDDKKWVIELTKDGTLWYNYNFFKDVFKYLSLDVVENQHYITKWVEDTIINGVKETHSGRDVVDKFIIDTLENGVKHTNNRLNRDIRVVEDTLENGIKEVKTDDSYRNYFKQNHKSEKVIENGIKETKKGGFNQHYDMFRTIEHGVKHTEYGDWLDGDERFDDIIQNGIKETKSPGADGDLLSTLEWMESNNTVNIPKLIDDVIENGVKRTEGGVLFDETKVDRIISEGVKETKCGGYLGSIEMKGKMVHQLESPKQNNEVDDVIEQGVKLTNSSLQIDGSCVVEDVIQNGIKETHDDVYHHKGRVGGVIKNGVKQCIPSHTPLYNPMDFSVVYRENHRLDDVASVLEKGIKEVQPLPSQEGNMDWGNYYHRQEDRTKPHTKYVDDVITSGIKKTKAMDEWVNTTNIVGKVIDNGIKE